MIDCHPKILLKASLNTKQSTTQASLNINGNDDSYNVTCVWK